MALRALPGRSRGDTDTTRRSMSEAEMESFYQHIFLPLVRRATWRHHLSKEDARDVVQDAFLLAIKRIDAAKNPRSWLIQVVDHLATNHQRKLIRRRKLAAKWGPTGREPESLGAHPDED